MKKRSVNNISSEVLAAFLDGNATAQESQAILGAFADDAALRELMQISRSVDATLSMQAGAGETLPMTALAASCEEGSYCSLECEKYILHRLGVAFDERQLLETAVQSGWQNERGTALHHVGRHLEQQGLVVKRQYKATLEELATALLGSEGVIVAVDGGELLGDRTAEIEEGLLLGELPDHTVVVKSCDLAQQQVVVFDPNSPNVEDCYPMEQFADAWADSKNYMVVVYRGDAAYDPRPIDLSDVTLPDELNELREAIAENAHDVWAAERKAQGWSYGPERNDERKENPCMVPYSQLPEDEKLFDREMAMNTLKLLNKLGYDIIKRKK